MFSIKVENNGVHVEVKCSIAEWDVISSGIGKMLAVMPRCVDDAGDVADASDAADVAITGVETPQSKKPSAPLLKEGETLTCLCEYSDGSKLFTLQRKNIHHFACQLSNGAWIRKSDSVYENVMFNTAKGKTVQREDIITVFRSYADAGNVTVALFEVIQRFPELSWSVHDFNRKIIKKINGYILEDKAKFVGAPTMTADNVKSLLHRFKYACYVCGDALLFSYKKRCMHQFTLDRINNDLPHNIDNVLPCCYYCNVRLWMDRNYSIAFKKCTAGCHNDTRIIRFREEALIDDFDKLTALKSPGDVKYTKERYALNDEQKAKFAKMREELKASLPQ